MTETIGYLASACSTVAFFPQVVKALTTRSVRDVSIYMLLVLLLSNGLWIYYGLCANVPPVTICNAVILVQVVLLVVLKRVYRTE